MDVMKRERYMSEEFDGWIVLMEGEHKKENKSIRGDVNMSECIFDGTYSWKEGFESVKHNVICSNEGNITMNGYNGDSIKKNTSLWIVIGDCRFETSEEKPDSLLYVPILKGVRYDGERHLTFYGEMMVGCNLSYELFMDAQLSTLNPVSLNGAESENDSIISQAVSNALFGGMNYTARLVYGMNITTEKKRILWPGEEYEEEEEEGGGRTSKKGGQSKYDVKLMLIVVMASVLVVVVGGGMIVGVRAWNRRKRRKDENERGGREEMLSVSDSLLSDVEGEGENGAVQSTLSTTKTESVTSDFQVLVPD